MSAQFRFPRFFVTSPSPCPYLPGRTERKVFTELNGENASELNDALGRIGFRRSQNVAYRPSCVDCTACVSVRVAAGEFRANATQRRLLRRNEDLQITACRPWTTEEQFELLRGYLSARHPGGGMGAMDENDFADMVEQTPVKTWMVEYREPAVDGLSMIYSFFDAAHERQGLGTLIVLDHIRRAAAAGLPYVYLGYWVRGSARMQYKTRYRPLEALGPAGWARMADEDAEPPAVLAPASDPMALRLD